MSKKLAKQIAKDLLGIQAVFLSPHKPFTWASGLHSPIYTDNRITIGYPIVRTHIAKGLAKIITEKYPSVQVIAGVATAGIPHAAWVAQELNLPMIYIRSKPKDHGKGRQIEGGAIKDQKVVVIDDLLSTGGSVIKAAKAAEKEGATILGVAGIFSYELPVVHENFKKAGFPFVTLTNYSTLIQTAVKEKYVDQNQLESLKKWRENPQRWSEDHK